VNKQTKNEFFQQLKDANVGDLVYIEWFDASIGTAISSGQNVDIPAKSWGLYLGVVGKRNPHVILAQNTFEYIDGFFDIDRTAVPLVWGVKLQVLQKQAITPKDAERLVTSLGIGRSMAMGRRKIRVRQVRISNHA